jgi:pumilio RNA-binding family
MVRDSSNSVWKLEILVSSLLSWQKYFPVRVLRNDVFGNYVVQKLLEFGTPLMKNQLRETLEGEMLNLSLQMYGCRVVQKALETLDEDHLPKLLTEFHHNVLSCIHDQNGNHVIQKCIEVMSMKAKIAFAKHDGERANFFGEQIDFILNDVLDNVTPLSCHPYGCRVLQRILEHCVEPKKIQALDEIAKCHKILLDDQYGNYVIQHVLQYGRHQDRESIMHIVIANGLLPLSKQKFASNVVEKLLKYGNATQRNLLVREMLVLVDDPKASSGVSPSRNGVSSVVLLMVRDAYANYVVQTTLDVVAEGEEKRLLLEELNAHADQLVCL